MATSSVSQKVRVYLRPRFALLVKCVISTVSQSEWNTIILAGCTATAACICIIGVDVAIDGMRAVNPAAAALRAGTQ